MLRASLLRRYTASAGTVTKAEDRFQVIANGAGERQQADCGTDE